MKPEEQTNERRISDSESKRSFKGMTPRQVQRRIKMPVGNRSEIESNQSTFKIGGKSRIIKCKDRILVEIFNEDADKIDYADIEKYFVLAKSPLLNMDTNKTEYDALFKLIPARRKMFHFALYMNNIGHYSGGRYYLMQIACLLAEIGHKVTVITDKLPFFIKDFKYIDYGDRLEFVAEERTRKTKWMLNATENKFDFIIESPLVKGGFLYARKWSVPVFSCLFESPNYVREYRQGADSTEEYWSTYKNGIINDSVSVLCLSEHAMLKAKEWLTGMYNGMFQKVSPCINTWVADRVTCNREENEIVFVGRHVGFKNPHDIILAVSRVREDLRPTINYIGSHSGNLREQMITYANTVNVDIKFFANITDAEKFFLIKRSKLMVFPSIFEGFGMGPAEALYCKKPVIAYDIPVLRSEYGDTIRYVDMNDIKALAKEIETLLLDKKARDNLGEKGNKAFYNRSAPIPCLPYTMKRSLKRVFYGGKDLSITAGMIAVNASDTISYALEAIYDSVDKIVVVEGAVEDYARVNPNSVVNYGSIDNTKDIVMSFPDPFDKITLVTADRLWKNKNEMQNEIANRIYTDLYLKVDADEIFPEYCVEYMKRYFMTDEKLDIMSILKYEFWKSLKMVAVGGIWNRPQQRMWRWHKDWKHLVDVKTGFNYYMDSEGSKVEAPKYKAISLMEKLCYHLGYVGDDKRITNKIKYYAGRGIEQNVIDNYTGWTPGMPTNSTNPIGTTAEEFKGELPLILRDWWPSKIEVRDVAQSLENNINMMASPPLKKGV